MQQQQQQSTQNTVDISKQKKEEGDGGGLLLMLSDSCWPACLQNVTQPDCRFCRYPRANTTRELTAACDDMPSMVGCSLWTMCQTNGLSSGLCDPFSLTGDVCSEPGMRSMPACHNFNLICPTHSQGILQCESQASIRKLPSTNQVHDAVLRMCEQMPMMDSCQQCSAVNCPDPLRTLGSICENMWMDGCDVLSSACSAVRQSSSARVTAGNDAQTLLREMLCPSSHHPQAPAMQMYFHWGFNDYVLFKSIVPANGTQYVLCIFGILAAGIVSSLLRGYKITREVFWSENAIILNDTRLSTVTGSLQETLLPDTHEAPTVGTGQDSVFKRNLQRAFLSGAMIVIDYALMLIAMTFNVGFFLAVVASFMLGQLFFGHIGHRDVYEPKALQIWHSALISVKGMTCESCVSTVQRALLALPVVRAQVNRVGERAVVTFDSNRVSVEELVEAVNDVGFEAVLQLESAERADAVLQDVVEGTTSCHP